MAFFRLVQILLRQVQILLRQVWPRAGCARRLVPHGPLPQEMVERVLLSPDLTQITDAGCAALAAALQSGALPALEVLYLWGTPASESSEASEATVIEVLESRGVAVLAEARHRRSVFSF